MLGRDGIVWGIILAKVGKKSSNIMKNKCKKNEMG